MEPKRKLDFEPQSVKCARVIDYFEEPRNISENGLLPHIQGALEQIQRAHESEKHLYTKAMFAVVIWGDLSTKNQTRETVQKVYHLCRQIIFQTNKFHPNEGPIAAISLDLAKFPLTRTQVDLLRFESNWACQKFAELGNKPDATVEIPIITVKQYEVMAQFFLGETPEIPPHEMPLYLAAAQLFETPSFAAFIAERLRDNIQNIPIHLVLTCYEGLQQVTSRYKQSLINDCLLRLAFQLLDTVKPCEQGYQLTVDSQVFIIKERDSHGKKDPLHVLFSIRMALKESDITRAKELHHDWDEYRTRSVGDFMAFRILALENLSPSVALNRLNRAMAKEKGNFPVLHKEGIDFLNAQAKIRFEVGELHAAMKITEQAVEGNPNSPEALYRMAKIYANTGKSTDEIIEKLEHALLANNRFHKARLLLAEMLGQKKKFAEAIAECNSLLQSNYKMSKVYGRRGSIYVQMNRFSEAIHDYKRQSALNPNATEPYMNLAECYITQENFSEALKCIMKVEKKAGYNDETLALRLLIPKELQEIPPTQEDFDDSL